MRKILIAMVAAVVMAAFALLSSWSLFDSSKYDSIKLRCDDATGLKLAAPVEMLGVKVGRVTKTAIDGREVVVQIAVEKGLALPVDSIFEAELLGLSGDKFIKITPGKGTELINEKTVCRLQNLPGQFLSVKERRMLALGLMDSLIKASIKPSAADGASASASMPDSKSGN